MLAPFANKIGATGNGIGFDTIPMRQLAWLHEAIYATSGGRTVSDELIEQLDERAIAAWYQDDGTFGGSYESWGHGKPTIACAGLSEADKERLAVRCEALGMGRPTISGHNLLFSGERARMFHERIAPYVHPSMDYKLHPIVRGRFAWDRSGVRRPSHRHDQPDVATPRRHESAAQVPQARSARARSASLEDPPL